MSLFNAIRNISRIYQKKYIFDKCFMLSPQCVSFNQERNLRYAYANFLKLMKVRREIAGPDKLRRRSEWFHWNYDAELYAFNKRLHENLSDETLRCVFVQPSYVNMEKQKRKDMEMQDVEFDIKSNESLVAHGQDILNQFLERYLKTALPLVPEEGICAVQDYLMSDDVLAHVSSHLGTKDLIFSEEYPPSKSTLASTLLAIVGGIAADDSVTRAENFVLDFVCPQLIGKDIFEIWEFNNPFQLLNSILADKGFEPAESRLIFESGRNTIEAVYQVGLYSNKQFLGKGIGETVSFAEEMAGYNVLRKFFQLNESRLPVPLGEEGRKIMFNSERKSVILQK